MVDGWLLTGDIGVVLPNGAIKIIDRAKNIFKLAQGEYIAPEKLENVYITSPYVNQIHVHGDSLQSYLVAIVVPDFEEIKKHYQAHEESKIGTLSNEEICQSSEVSTLILDNMNQLATQAKFNGLERVKQVYLTPEEFTVENNLLTPSMKLKRQVSEKLFRQQINAMYGILL